MTIAESLKRFRKTFKLTQKEVANTLGIKQQSYVYETKDVTPSAKVLMKIADTYNVSVDYLLGRTDNPSLNETPKVVAETEKENEIQSLKEQLAKLTEKVNNLAS